jgi:hypothetical protein
MWWRITLQSALAFGCLFFGWNFWATIKCWQYRKRFLSSPALLDQFATKLGYKRIFDQSGNFLVYSDLKNIAQFESDSNSALVVAGNVLLLGAGIASALSYALHPYFLGIDIAIFCWGGIVPINRRMKNNMLFEVQQILLYLCRWTLESPQECSANVASKMPPFINALCTAQKINARHGD